MRRASLFFFALPLFAATPFTIEHVLSAPFSNDLTASPGRDAVAWVQYAQGARNVWVARAPGYQGAPWTKYTADDGQEIDDIAWKADGSALFFTHGGSPNGRGEFPNPTSDPRGARQEIWMATSAGDAKKIGDGHSPAVAPDASL